MEGYALEEIGENERLLLCVCKYADACLKFRETASPGDAKQVSAVMSGLSRDPSSRSGSDYELESLPKTNREDACLSIIRQMLFSDVAKAIGVPVAASVDELRLKLEVIDPS